MRTTDDAIEEGARHQNAAAGFGRWGTLAGAALLVTYGVTRRSAPRDRGITAREAIRVDRPRAEVYRFWHEPEHLPRFMAHVESVTGLGNGRSHWVVRGPAGRRVEWDAELVSDVENDAIAWHSLPGAPVDAVVSAHFDPMRGGQSTQVTVSLQCVPRSGRARAARLLGPEPSRTLRGDLRRMKQLVEAG
jgi:uncharacterized membrane protein